MLRPAWHNRKIFEVFLECGSLMYPEPRRAAAFTDETQPTNLQEAQVK
jgi:hypothetical protein